MINYSDEQLVAEYLKGNKESLEILIRRYLKPLYNFAYRYVGNSREAEDITQEAFLRVWRNLKKFDQKKKFKIWAFAITKNLCVDFLRKKKTISFSDLEGDRNNRLEETLADASPLPQEILERKDISRTVISALKKLPAAQRITLFLRFNDHFTFREIAESMGEPLHTVKSRHRRALIKLKGILTK
jgi:RNA polymerase sigma-70 factor (ECF subfamily)